MKDQTPGWEELNAYVDGELDVGTSSRVARAVAEDAETARAVAALAQLKAAAANAPGEAPEITLPEPRRVPWRRIAASLAAVVVAGAAALYVLLPAGDGEPAWLAASVAPHQSWAATADTAGAGPRAGVFLATLSRLGGDAFAPDLSAARLTIARLRYVPGDGNRAAGIHVGYAGTRGCRISLWITPDAGRATDTLARHDGARGAVFAWRAGRLAYVLRSAGMAAGRFAMIARAAFAATRARAAPDDGMRTALRDSRAASPPCAG